MAANRKLSGKRVKPIATLRRNLYGLSNSAFAQQVVNPLDRLSRQIEMVFWAPPSCGFQRKVLALVLIQQLETVAKCYHCSHRFDY